ncbi:MATH and LRR domain-containing protein PFE0570w-like isoform X2 [Microplitis mediator]|nr:MATH and LRR domain-containing protein PFE0570w-like isoform X2 [Microplitis mediator]
MQVGAFDRGFTMNQQGNYLTNSPYQDPYPFAQVQGPAQTGFPFAQSYPYTNQNPLNVSNIAQHPIYNSLQPQGATALEHLRPYIQTQPTPIFILPSNPVVQLPSTQGPNCPNTRTGACGTQFCCSPAPMPPPYIPYPCPLPYPTPFCRPAPNCRDFTNCHDTSNCKDSSNCSCCPKRPFDCSPCDFTREHRCEPTHDTICSKTNCPASISLQALASQLLSIPGVISCAATRLVLRRVPGSNIRNSTEETVERARKTINTLTQEQLLTETRNAQQINALINLHMAANPPANIIPLLTTVQLKVNVLKNQLESIINHRICENQGAGAETCVGLDPTVLSFKSDQELRTLLATLRQKECDERVNLNFASYHSQRVIAETRLRNIEDKITAVEAEIERRRCACIPPTLRQTRLTCHDSRGTVWHAYPGTLPASSTPMNFASFNQRQIGQPLGQPSPRDCYSSDPFNFDDRNPRRLNLRPHVGSPETTYRKPPALIKQNSDKLIKDSDDDCDIDTADNNDTNTSSNNDNSNSNNDDNDDKCNCDCDKSTEDENEDKKKLQKKVNEADQDGETEIYMKNNFKNKNVYFYDDINFNEQLENNEKNGDVIEDLNASQVIDEKNNSINRKYGNYASKDVKTSRISSMNLKTSSSSNNNNNEIKISRQVIQDKLLLQLNSAVDLPCNSSNNYHHQESNRELTSDGNKYTKPLTEQRNLSESGSEEEITGLDKFIYGALSVIGGFSNQLASFGSIIGNKISALKSHLVPEISNPLLPSFSNNLPNTSHNSHYLRHENSNTFIVNNSRVKRLNLSSSGIKNTGGELFIEFNSNDKLSKIKNIIIEDKTNEKIYILMRRTLNSNNNDDNKLWKKLYKEDKTLLIRSRFKNSQSMSSRIQLTPFIPFTAVTQPKCLSKNTVVVKKNSPMSTSPRESRTKAEIKMETRRVLSELSLSNVGCNNNRYGSMDVIKSSKKFRSLSKIKKFKEIKEDLENETEINYEYQVTLRENSSSFDSRSNKSNSFSFTSRSCRNTKSTSGESSFDEILKVEILNLKSMKNIMEISTESILNIHDYSEL